MNNEEYLYSATFYKNNKKTEGVSTVESILLNLLLNILRDIGKLILYHDKIEIKIEKVKRNEENKN